ncbi:MAG: hypothetical protein LQ337_006294 [Flavoplaca oasis]|nr:MAG: hypothetical protein LQ337_006294 [Flavoplaca oasis]
MKLLTSIALQLLQLAPHVARTATLPSKHLEGQQHRETRQTFDETTIQLEQQGSCRRYHDFNEQKEDSLGTCWAKCGDLIWKAHNIGETGTVNCIRKVPDTHESIDPDGYRYSPGDCTCEAPITDQSLGDISMPLPVIKDIGCSILYSTFDSVLEHGQSDIPETKESMNVGQKAATQAAKTVAENRKDAQAFMDWFAPPCEKSNYTNTAEKLFDALTDVPDSAISSLHCNTKLCARKKASAGGSTRGSTGGSTGASKGQDTKGNANGKKPSKGDTSKSSSRESSASSTQSTKIASKTQGKGIQSSTGLVAPVSEPTQSTKSAIPKTQESSAVASTLATSQKFSSTGPSTTATSQSSSKFDLAIDDEPEIASSAAATEVIVSDPISPAVGGNSLPTTDVSGFSNTDGLTEAPPVSTGITESDTFLNEDPSWTSSTESITSQTASTVEDTDAYKDIGEDENFQVSKAPIASQTASAVEDTVAPNEDDDDGTSPITQDDSIASPTAPVFIPESSSADFCRASRSNTNGELTERDLASLRLRPTVGRTTMGIDRLDQVAMHPDCLMAYAKKGFEQVEKGGLYQYGVILISALFVPGVGVLVGSKPRENIPVDPSPLTVAEHFRNAAAEFPFYALEINRRTSTDPKAKPIDLWHSEDNVFLHGAEEYCKAKGIKPIDFKGFPTHTSVATYGRSSAFTAAELNPSYKLPCGGPGAKINPSCRQVLSKLKVSFVMPQT